VNQCPRPLQSSTDSNLVDMGRCNQETPANRWAALVRTLSTYGRGTVPGKTVMYPAQGCRGEAGRRPHHPVIGERGNRDGLALTPRGEGRAHGLHRGPSRDGVLVVVGGRESRPHGEGGQQAGQNYGWEERWR
jgi:hypothetical protein